MKVVFMPDYPAEAARRNGFLGSDSVLHNKPFRIAELAKSKESTRTKKNCEG